MRTKYLVIATICCILFTLQGREVYAKGLTFLNGRLHIGGFHELLMGIHTEDPYKSLNGVVIPKNDRLWEEAGNLSLFRNTIQPEIEFKLSDNITAYSIIRFFYDGLFDITNNINKLPENRLDKPDHGEDILREFYIDIDLTDWHIRIGKQQVVWGESDALRMADIINPLDISWHGSTESWEDIRIPLRAIDTRYTGFDWHNLEMEFLWIPEDFKPTKLPPEGAQWSIPGLTQPILDFIDHNEPNKHTIKNSEFGLRTRGNFGRWELALFYFYSRSDDAMFHLDQFFQPRIRWPFYNTIGGSFNVYEERTETVFRGEWAYNIQKPFSPKELVGFNPHAFQVYTFDIIRLDVFSFMLGFDRPIWIKPLNSQKVFLFSGQLFNTHILNYDHNVSTSTQSDDSSQTVASLLVSTSYFHEFIQPQILMVYDFSGTGWLQPQLKYVPSDYINIALGANLFWSTSLRDSIWGPIRNNDEIYLRIRFTF